MECLIAECCFGEARCMKSQILIDLSFLLLREQTRLSKRFSTSAWQPWVKEIPFRAYNLRTIDLFAPETSRILFLDLWFFGLWFILACMFRWRVASNVLILADVTHSLDSADKVIIYLLHLLAGREGLAFHWLFMNVVNLNMLLKLLYDRTKLRGSIL